MLMRPQAKKKGGKKRPKKGPSNAGPDEKRAHPGRLKPTFVSTEMGTRKKVEQELTCSEKKKKNRGRSKGEWA